MQRPKKLPRDANSPAARIVALSTGEEEPKLLPDSERPQKPAKVEKEKNPAAVELGRLGRLGGLKGGKARAAKLTPAKRKEIAQKAARIRWKA